MTDSQLDKVLAAALALIILVAFVSCKINIRNYQETMKEANEFALNSVFDMKEYIDVNERCPDQLAGWKKSEGSTKFNTMTYGQFRLERSCDESLNFSVSVVYAFDSSDGFYGKLNSPVTIIYGHFTDPQYLKVENRQDIGTALEQIYGF